MGKRIAISVIILCAAQSAYGATTLLHRELFVSSRTNVIGLSSTNKDQFDAVTGTIPIAAVGAKATNQTDNGWSGLTTLNNFGSWNACPATGYASAWYYISSASASSAAIMAINNGSYDDVFIMVDSAGKLYGPLYQVDTGATIPLNQWVLLTLAWKNRGGSSYDARIYVGSTQITAITNINVGGVNSVFKAGVSSSAAAAMRISGVSLYSMSDFSDISLPPTDLIAPTYRNSWYFNSATGSDSYSGDTAQTPFQSALQLATFLNNGGFIQCSNSIPWVYVADGSAAYTNITTQAWVTGVTNGTIRSAGDKIMIDTSSAPFVWNRQQTFNSTAHNGVELCSASASKATLTMFTSVTSPFSQYDGVNFPNIWTTTNTGAHSVLWEDRRWMSSPLGGNITAVRTNLNNNAGSFWTDGTTLYFSPFEAGQNPNSQTNVYERSYKMLNGTGSTPVFADAIDLTAAVHVHDLTIEGNCFRDPSSGAVDVAYAIHPLGGVYAAVGNCLMGHNGNHAYGATDGPSNTVRLVYNSWMGNGPPWTDNGSGFTSAVEFTPQNWSGQVCYYIDCNFATNGVVGSASGATGNGNAWGSLFSHASGGNLSPYNFTKVERSVGSLGIGIATNTVITNCLIGSLTLDTNATTTCSTVTGTIGGSGPATIQNCLLLPAVGADFGHGVAIGPNAWTIMLSTIDTSGMTGGTWAYLNLATNTLNFSNNVVIATQPFVQLPGTINSDRNAWVVETSNFYYQGTYKTWAQWVSAGYDANSITNASVCLGPGYHPYAKTPCWKVGAELGPATDYTGKLFQSRRTAGAYEYMTPAPWKFNRR